MIQTINFMPGDTVQVHQKIQEGEKTRIQIFEGVVLGINGRGENKMFTVRKASGGFAVEKMYPVNSLNIDKVVVKAAGNKLRAVRNRVRRAKLYFLRDK